MASKSYDINIIEKDYTPFQELNLEFSGNDINKVLINTLRRVILLDNPTYAFHNLQVKKNTSVFNKDSNSSTNGFKENRLSIVPLGLPK